jgi:hypothetical protein
MNIPELEDYKYFITNYDENDSEILLDDSEDEPEPEIDEKINYCYKLPEVEQYIKLLSKDRANNYEEWIKTGFCLFNINPSLINSWLEFSKQSKKYNKIECVKLWGTFKHDPKGLKIGSLHKWAKEDNPTEYEKILNNYSYKEFIPITMATPEQTFNTEYITLWKPAQDIFNKRNIIIKSEGKTGKTTAFTNYIKYSGLKFISIVNQISTADKHINDFRDAKINVIDYQQMEQVDINNNNNFVICINSILKIEKLDFTDKVIILDEVNSLCKSILGHEEMKNRGAILPLLMHMIKTSKQTISVDADISDLVFELYDGIPYHFYHNIYKSYEYINNTKINIKAYEVKNIINMTDKIIHEIKEGGRPMICSDSKRYILELYELLIKELPTLKDNFKLYTKDTRRKIYNINEEWRGYTILFSPKITTGIDYNPLIPTNVYSFCGMTNKTIDSTTRTQQIMRCRNIKNIYYHWKSKKSFPAMFNDVLHVKQYYKENLNKFIDFIKEIGANVSIDDKTEINDIRFSRMIYINEYFKDTLNTNKKKHYEILLEKKGITIIKDDSPDDIRTIKDDTRYTAAKNSILLSKEEQIEAFINDELEEDDPFKKEMVVKIGDIFNIDLNDKDFIREYKNILFDDFRTADHWGIRKILNPIEKLINDIENKLSSDYKEIVINSVNAKVALLFKIDDILKIDHGFNFNVDMKTLEDKINNGANLLDSYKCTFRDRSKMTTLKNNYDLIKLRVKIIRNITGLKFGLSDKVFNKIRYTIPRFDDNDALEYHKVLIRKSKGDTDTENRGCIPKNTISSFIDDVDDVIKDDNIIIEPIKPRFIRTCGELVRIN